MKVLNQKINRNQLLSDSKIVFDEIMVKGVVDVEKELLALDAELHADLERLLLNNGSNQENLWGINLYPDEDEFVEFNSMINIRPHQNNRSRYVEDEAMRTKITKVVKKWIA